MVAPSRSLQCPYRPEQEEHDEPSNKGCSLDWQQSVEQLDVTLLVKKGTRLSSSELVSNSNGLQPTSDGLQPHSDEHMCTMCPEDPEGVSMMCDAAQQEARSL